MVRLGVRAVPSWLFWSRAGVISYCLSFVIGVGFFPSVFSGFLSPFGAGSSWVVGFCFALVFHSGVGRCVPVFSLACCVFCFYVCGVHCCACPSGVFASGVISAFSLARLFGFVGPYTFPSLLRVLLVLWIFYRRVSFISFVWGLPLSSWLPSSPSLDFVDSGFFSR